MKPDDTYDSHTCHDNCPRIACVLRRELIAMIKQRDRLRECIAELEDERDRLRKIVDEQCRFSSVCCEYREQRDRMAMALQELCVALLTANPLDITELLNKAGDALQSLTNPNEL